METKNNYCTYDTKNGKIKAFFKLYQGRNGGIYIMIASKFTVLNLNQINELFINCYEIQDFDHDKFIEYYGLL